MTSWSLLISLLEAGHWAVAREQGARNVSLNSQHLEKDWRDQAAEGVGATARV